LDETAEVLRFESCSIGTGAVAAEAQRVDISPNEAIAIEGDSRGGETVRE
jgi:hypothetical protein